MIKITMDTAQHKPIDTSYRLEVRMTSFGNQLRKVTTRASILTWHMVLQHAETVEHHRLPSRQEPTNGVGVGAARKIEEPLLQIKSRLAIAAFLQWLVPQAHLSQVQP